MRSLPLCERLAPGNLKHHFPGPSSSARSGFSRPRKTPRKSCLVQGASGCTGLQPGGGGRLLRHLRSGGETCVVESHHRVGEVKHDRACGTVHLSQRSYIDSILRRYGFEDAKPVSTPFDTQVRLTLEQALADAAEFAVMRDVVYREAVGALNWVVLATRPDIAFAVSTVASFSTNPGMARWNTVKRVFRYLAGTRDLWLTYGEARRALVGYADADGSMSEDRCAHSDCVHNLYRQCGQHREGRNLLSGEWRGGKDLGGWLKPKP